ncbi:DNA-directed RNA polymerase subunit omega [Oligoflexaceae bacterium]|nr:DNA-directed RNA polymerase subunit omega [Oligoflexaceae bacterium]
MARVSIEDCLTHMDNRFALVKVAAERARQMISGEDPFIKTKNKECVTALREIAEGIVQQQGQTQEDKTESLAYTKMHPEIEAAIEEDALEAEEEAEDAAEESTEDATEK